MINFVNKEFTLVNETFVNKKIDISEQNFCKQNGNKQARNKSMYYDIYLTISNKHDQF